nr:nucleotidyltransferase domain-containing protein [Clostridia bacterium]
MSNRISKYGEVIPMSTRSTISTRYHNITKAINKEFWNSSSDSTHSFYVGSYGRGTAIDTSDIDILVELPKAEYERYDYYKGNGQSRLLQAVKSAIVNTYYRTDVRADGQVIKISFSDGMKIEVLPAFANTDWYGRTIYSYPDSNMGGNWKSTNPKAEQTAMKDKNSSSNGLLFDTCKHMRFIRDTYFSSYHLSGIVIDSFAYMAIGDWRWTEQSSVNAISDGKYETVLYNYYLNYCRYSSTINAPGSNDSVSMANSRNCLEKVLYKMTQE